jgi:hypothetical protein
MGLVTGESDRHHMDEDAADGSSVSTSAGGGAVDACSTIRNRSCS